MDKEDVYIYNGIQLGHKKKKNKFLPFATCVDFENIMLSEISQTQKDKYCIISFICESKKIQQTSEYNKKETDSVIENKLVVNQWGERRGDGIKRYKLLCIK